LKIKMKPLPFDEPHTNSRSLASELKASDEVSPEATAVLARERLNADRDPEVMQLLKAVRQGCKASFEKLYVLTSPHLFAVLIRATRHRKQAEDLLQDTYVEVWKQSGSSEPEAGHAMAWLSALAQRIAMDKLSLMAGLFQGSGQLNACNADNMLRSLPVDQYQILKSVFADDLSCAQAAARMDCRVATVKGSLRRSFAALHATHST
jgi:DNA-directed RNA polymerase specialized sigma24 family protein